MIKLATCRLLDQIETFSITESLAASAIEIALRNGLHVEGQILQMFETVVDVTRTICRYNFETNSDCLKWLYQGNKLGNSGAG